MAAPDKHKLEVAADSRYSPPALVLASSSPYRAGLLARLALPFAQDDPAIDESRLPEESVFDYVRRLAIAKARAVAPRHPGAILIGSDQAAAADGDLLGKPGSTSAACGQLERLSGRSVEFLTAVAVLDGGGEVQCEVDRTLVTFRRLSRAEIAAYVQREQPLDCAGSFKAEGLGIALFERILTEDPTALVGLPLIALCRLLRQAGIEPLGAPASA